MSRVPGREALLRLVRAALRGEIADVALASAPKSAEPHALDVHAAGLPPIALLADPAGAPDGARFPLRLMPLYPGQIARLHALLESDGREPEGSGVVEDGAPADGAGASLRPEGGPRATSPPLEERESIPSSGAFFDEALASLPAPPLEEGELDDGVLHDDPEVFVVEESCHDGFLFDEPDQDEDTLVRSVPPAPAERPETIVRPEARAREEMTPTMTQVPSPVSQVAPARGEHAPRASHHGPPLRSLADGKYTLESLIAKGGAGSVYRATHRELKRTVAIKVLHPHYQDDPHFMASFRAEALAASQLDHPNVMRVLDFDQEPDGLIYLVMEHLPGRTLQSVLDEERLLAPLRAIEVMMQVCAALSVAHDHGVIHRDIKPDNIMLVPSRDDEGELFELVKVCDFGIAERERAEHDVGLDPEVTAGTPHYMSPEQTRGGPIDHRSDLYACGVCLYELVTGCPPFMGASPDEILSKQLHELPVPPSQLQGGLDPGLEALILRALDKDPNARPSSARELRAALRDLAEPSAIPEESFFRSAIPRRRGADERDTESRRAATRPREG